VETAAVRRNALSSQDAVVVVAPNSRWRSGSAGTTIVCISENESTAVSRAANVPATSRPVARTSGVFNVMP
jgi:hypothetical protein